MAETQERITAFRNTALVLVDDAVFAVTKLKKLIKSGQYDKAESLSGALQDQARDIKWIMRRLPKGD